MDWQVWTTVALIAAAALYLAFKWWPSRRARAGRNFCACCAECAPKGPNRASNECAGKTAPGTKLD